jgi:hypothetical protein
MISLSKLGAGGDTTGSATLSKGINTILNKASEKQQKQILQFIEMADWTAEGTGE